jgi:hypothetical protein
VKPCYLISVSSGLWPALLSSGLGSSRQAASLLQVADIKTLTKTIVGIIYGAIIAWIALLIIVPIRSTVQGGGKRRDPNEAGI